MESKKLHRHHLDKNQRFVKKTWKNYESNEIKEKKELCKEKIDSSTINTFGDFPISKRTINGLSEAGFEKPTEIQKDGIALALRGLDVLAAAKTGSGKTLAFLIPILELLWRKKWSNTDGLGALIITPTRELALQIFEVLRKVGKKHDFSAGLIIGGKDLSEEQSRITTTNVIICTPGRLLQHFDETPNFLCDDLQILVLDEADRILDLGFAKTLNAIIENLPEQRQTLLYSATQTKSVKDLARLSLNQPEYIAVHEQLKYATPNKLQQSYSIVKLYDKINFLFSFLKSHKKTKTIIFLSSCKQVKFLYEVFRKLRPGAPVLGLYGKQKQLKRVGIYNRFCNCQAAFLFATDIAARGLDFPSVNWVIQFDCPENADTYIHRAGRTARYEKGGQALLLLLPSEKQMVDKLKERKIPIHEIQANPKKIRSIEGSLQGFCAQHPEIKHWAERSIVSYVRSVYLQADKEVFDVRKLPVNKFATSCGLLAPPKIRFIKKLAKKLGPSTSAPVLQKQSSQTQKLNIEVIGSKKGSIEIGNEVESDDEDDVLVQKNDKQAHEDLQDLDEMELETKKSRRERAVSKATLAKRIIRKNIKVNTKISFDDEGKVFDGENELSGDDDISTTQGGGIDVEKAKERMRKEDKVDRAAERKRIKEKHRTARKKLREERKANAVGSTEMTLQLSNEDEQMDNDEQIASDEDDDKSESEEQPPKKRRRGEKRRKEEPTHDTESTSLVEDEELALHLLTV